MTLMVAPRNKLLSSDLYLEAGLPYELHIRACKARHYIELSKAASMLGVSKNYLFHQIVRSPTMHALKLATGEIMCHPDWIKDAIKRATKRAVKKHVTEMNHIVQILDKSLDSSK